MPSYTLLHHKGNFDYTNFLLSSSSCHSRLSSNVCLNFISCLNFHVYLPIPSTTNQSETVIPFLCLSPSHLPSTNFISRPLPKDQIALTFTQHLANILLHRQVAQRAKIIQSIYKIMTTQSYRAFTPQGNTIFTVILTQDSFNQTNKNPAIQSNHQFLQ